MAKEPRAKTGRPSAFTPKTANTICDRLIGGESLRGICRDADMPDASTVCRWLGQNEEFRQQYAHAREAQADTMADDILDIADGAEAVSDAVAVARDRLRVDARKWLAAKMAPKKYGDKVALTGGGDGDAPIKTELTVKFVG